MTKRKILIGGDLSPVRRYTNLFSNSDFCFLGNDVKKIIDDSDLFAVNFELALSDKSLRKKNILLPKLIAESSVVKGIKDLGVDVCNLANNHVLDSGKEGFNNIIKEFDEYNISYFGGGSNINESNKLLVKDVKGVKVGFFGISNNEFSIASEISCGANPEDLVDWYYTVPKYRKQVDFLVIFYHTGLNRNIYPTPILQKKAKLLVDLGADCVVCQHSHIIGTYEKYKSKMILYGQGDFIFDYGVDIKDDRKYGNFLLLEVDDSMNINYQIHYFIRNGINVDLLSNGKNVLPNSIDDRSKKLKDEVFLKQEYIKYINSESDFMNILLSFGNKRLLKLLNKLNLADKFITRNYAEVLFNLFKNDIHSDIIIEKLRKRL